MRFEIPECRRCCLFVPLRYGILIFGYLNLCFSTFLLGLFVFLYISRPRALHSSFLYRGVEMHTQLWFCYFVCILEIVFNVVLLVGAHKKNSRLIRMYYYYGIVTTLASFMTYLVLVRKMPFDPSQSSIFYPIEFCLALSGLLIQCYLLLVIRSELRKLKYQGGPFRYNNHIAEVVSDAGPGREELAV